jgi:hypothetical protein
MSNRGPTAVARDPGRSGAGRRRLLRVAILSLVAGTQLARADGRMVAGERELFRRGPSDRGYCGQADAECDLVMTKVLSGFGYLRGRFLGGIDAAALRVALASAALPGGEVALLAVEGLYGDDSRQRWRATLLDSRGLFICHARQGQLVGPLLGVITGACPPDAFTAVDVALLAAQWDVASGSWMAEWMRVGLSFELLGNGFGHAHLLRSLMVGVPLDLRSSSLVGAGRDVTTSAGAGVRVAALFRTPHWESRVDLRYRTALAGGDGPRKENDVEGEIRLAHNFFASDALVLQLGISLAASWAQQPGRSFAVFASAERRWTQFAGIYLGWIGEPAEI